MEDLKKLLNLIWLMITKRIAVVVLGSVLTTFGITADQCSWVDPDWQPEISTTIDETQEDINTPESIDNDN